MVMILAAISIALTLQRPYAEPKVTCRSGAVSYKFVGVPGTLFRYGGEDYTVPPRGWIELISDGPDSKYTARGRELPLDVWPIDEFGRRTVPLPKPQLSSQGGSDDASHTVR
jgi:hypothetical protein